MTEAPVEANLDAQEWNPFAAITTEEIPLKASGGRVSILYRKWSGRERLAFEDILTQRMLTKDEAGGDTIKIGTLRLYAATLTVVGSRGFEAVPGAREGFLTGTPAEIEEDLLSITEQATLDEIVDTARKVQPLPRLEADADDDAEGDEGEDPSPTPSTPATVDGEVVSGSPAAS